MVGCCSAAAFLLLAAAPPASAFGPRGVAGEWSGAVTGGSAAGKVEGGVLLSPPPVSTSSSLAERWGGELRGEGGAVALDWNVGSTSNRSSPEERFSVNFEAPPPESDADAGSDASIFNVSI